MPPDSDTIEVQIPSYLPTIISHDDLFSDNEIDINTQANEAMETDNPTTPIEQNTQRSTFEIPLLYKCKHRVVVV
jgi:hypothetical protein